MKKKFIAATLLQLLLLLLFFLRFDVIAQFDLPIRVAVYGPEGVGPYSEHPCIPTLGGVECNFQNASALNVPRRYFGVIFQSGWGHVQGPNGPRAGNFEVVDGQSHGFRAGCPPGCQTVQLHPHIGGSGPPLIWAAPNSAAIVEVERINDYTVFIKTAGSTSPPIPSSDRDGDGVPDSQDRCPDQFGQASNSGCPIQPPSPTGGNMVTDGNRSIALTVHLDRRFTLSECFGITVYAWEGSGEEIILEPLSGCTYGVPSFMKEVWIRIGGWWWISASGCAFVKQGNAAYLVLTNCFTQVASPPSVAKDIICLLAGPDRHFDDQEIIEALNLWIAQGRNPSVAGTIPDGMMVAMISLWVTGEDCGKFSNIRFTSLSYETTLTKAQKKQVKALLEARKKLGKDAKCDLQKLEVAFGLKRKLSPMCLKTIVVKQQTTLLFIQRRLERPDIVFSNLDPKVKAVKIEIFAPSGNRLYFSDWETNFSGRLLFELRIILANGVYPLVITSQDVLGNMTRRVSKLIIIK